MIGRKLLLLVSIYSGLTACATVKEAAKSETQQGGGAVGYLLDTKNTQYKAAGDKPTQVYRAIVGMALIARVGEASLKDNNEVDAFISYMSYVADDINNLAGHLDSNSCDFANKKTNCRDYYQLFESDLPKLEADMIRFGLAALPRKEAAKFLESVSSGNPLGIATSVFKLGSKIVVAGHGAAATVRSEREIFAAIIRETAAPDGTSVPYPTTQAALTAIENKRKVISNSVLSVEELTNEKVQPLYFHIRDICKRLPYTISNTQLDANALRTARLTACANIKWAPTPDRYL